MIWVWSFVVVAFFGSAKALVSVPQSQKMSNGQARHQASRVEVLQQFAVFGLGAFLLPSFPARAEDLLQTSSRRIAGCKSRRGSPSNCVSTSSVNKVDCYVAPWTFNCNAEDAQKILKTVFEGDPLTYTNIYEEKGYLRVNAGRGLVTDELEFVFDESEQLVKVRSGELSDDPSISDFGANRRRLDLIRKQANVFEVMGGSFDSIEDRGTGPVAQLRAFYGLQSGYGFETLYD